MILLCIVPFWVLVTLDLQYFLVRKSFYVYLYCHVLRSQCKNCKMSEHFRKKTPTMYPWDPMRTGEPGTWWTTGRSCCIPNGGMAGGGGSGLHELCMRHLVARCSKWMQMDSSLNGARLLHDVLKHLETIAFLLTLLKGKSRNSMKHQGISWHSTWDQQCETQMEDSSRFPLSTKLFDANS